MTARAEIAQNSIKIDLRNHLVDYGDTTGLTHTLLMFSGAWQNIGFPI
jgi:hypothetical protein